jgi:hypothetical protein
MTCTSKQRAFTVGSNSKPIRPSRYSQAGQRMLSPCMCSCLGRGNLRHQIQVCCQRTSICDTTPPDKPQDRSDRPGMPEFCRVRPETIVCSPTPNNPQTKARGTRQCSQTLYQVGPYNLFVLIGQRAWVIPKPYGPSCVTASWAKLWA